MSSAYYEIYLKGVFDLASTLVVKSEDTAAAINARLTELGKPVDAFDPTTWKYYLNLAGQYHSTDTPMTITSLDTQEVIAFTHDNLLLHRATKREYTYRSRYYKELVQRYPLQEQLILGILNPIDLQEAIAAEDHTILYYDRNLVEAGEVNFIERLQQWINAFFLRWEVTDYRITDSLYVAAQLGTLFAHLPKAILNIRLENCKTDYAHSFHIQQYLESFGKLGQYFEFLTQKQKLFLYRNIRYINRNNGKIDIFEWLTQKILTDRRFPLAEYNIRHNNEKQPDTIYPDIQMRRQSINGLASALGQDVRTVDEVLDMQTPLARDNPVVQKDASVDIPLVMRNSLSSQLKTKVLESNVLDTTDAEPFTLTEVLFSHWSYLANTGRYSTVLTVTNPGTGETMRVNAKDAFTLYLYAYNKARGMTLAVVPEFEAMRVKREPLPTRQELLGIVDRRWVPDALVDYALTNQPVLDSYISVDAFREICIDLHAAMLLHRDLYAYQPHFITRGQLKVMTDRFYMNYPINVGSTKPYTEWFEERSLAIEQLTDLELDLLASDVYQQATGVDAKSSKTVKEVHAAMLKLQAQLSSYSVQYIQQINSGTLKIIDWPRIRPGDYRFKGGQTAQVILPRVESGELQTRGKMHWYLDLKRLERFSGYSKRKQKATLKIGLDYTLVGKGASGGRVRLGVVPLWIDETLIDLGTIKADPVTGYENLEKGTLASIFSSLTSDGYVPLTSTQKSKLDTGA